MSASTTARPSTSRTTYPVNEVTQVGQQLIVVGGDEGRPHERRVAVLWSLREKVISPDGRRLASLLGIVAEDTDGQTGTALNAETHPIFLLLLNFVSS